MNESHIEVGFTFDEQSQKLFFEIRAKELGLGSPLRDANYYAVRALTYQYFPTLTQKKLVDMEQLDKDVYHTLDAEMVLKVALIKVKEKELADEVVKNCHIFLKTAYENNQRLAKRNGELTDVRNREFMTVKYNGVNYVEVSN